MSRVLIIASCEQCNFNRDTICALSGKEFSDEFVMFPEWCQLRTPEEFCTSYATSEKSV